MKGWGKIISLAPKVHILFLGHRRGSYWPQLSDNIAGTLTKMIPIYSIMHGIGRNSFGWLAVRSNFLFSGRCHSHWKWQISLQQDSKQ
jgi:hypothetical protein